MKIFFSAVFILLVSCSTPATKQAASETTTPNAAKIIPSDDVLPAPEIVQSEDVQLVGKDTKFIKAGNVNGSYSLACRLSASMKSCITPTPGASYYVFNTNTHWRMPGASKDVDLAFFQDWSVTYNDAENIALVAVSKNAESDFGMYWLRSWTKKSQ